jgi:transposase-like protein
MNNGKSFFQFGDLVRVDGYGDRIFEVLGYRVEQYFYPDEQHTDIVFELSDAHTLEWLEADENDLTLICREDKAEEYLAEGVTAADPTERKLTPREESSRLAEERKQLRKMKAEIIDDLLDRIRDYRRLYAMFGDEEFSDVVFALEAEINKLNEE